VQSPRHHPSSSRQRWLFPTGVPGDQRSGSLCRSAKPGRAGRAPRVRVSSVRARRAGAVATPYPRMSGGPGSCCTGWLPFCWRLWRVRCRCCWSEARPPCTWSPCPRTPPAKQEQLVPGPGRSWRTEFSHALRPGAGLAALDMAEAEHNGPKICSLTAPQGKTSFSRGRTCYSYTAKSQGINPSQAPTESRRSSATERNLMESYVGKDL